MSSGMLFHIIWNIVPSYLEQGYILAVTRRFTLNTMKEVKNRQVEPYKTGTTR